MEITCALYRQTAEPMIPNRAPSPITHRECNGC